MRLRRAVLVVLVACSAEHARDTNELLVAFRIDQPEGGGRTRYQATFTAGGGFVKLDPGDEVRVTSDGAPPAVLTGDNYYLGQTYFLDRDDPPFTTATFDLFRVRGGGAPRSIAPFPPALTGVVPAEGTSLSYGDGSNLVTMRWSNKVEGAIITLVTHACDHADNRVPSNPDPDAGALALPIRDLVVDGPPKTSTCLRLELRRALRGTLDPIITTAGSTVTGYLVHTTTVNVTP